MSDEKFIVTGGKRLHGSVRLGGAKNASFKLMIATLLAEGETHLLNIPRINDVEITRRILEALGGSVRSAGERLLCVDTSAVNSAEIPKHFGKESRASSMFIAPLIARLKRAVVPLPGGDRIGKRPLERHFAGLEALGAEVSVRNNLVTVSATALRGTHFRFEKNSHTGTETMILASVLAQGTTVLENAAEEPEVNDLIAMLVQMGARIERDGRDIRIEGVRKLHPTTFGIMPDRNEAVSYAAAAVATGGDVIVENARKNDLTAFLEKLSETGGGYELGNFGIRFFSKGPLRAVDVVTGPHPGFMTDWQPLWAVLMTQAQGVSLIHEAVHTDRFRYVGDLMRMGAKIELVNPQVKDHSRFYNFNPADDRPDFKHAANIQGPVALRGMDLVVHDLRAGATLVLAALIAQGKSTITGIEHIDRGYENLDGRLNDLGASIKRI